MKRGSPGAPPSRLKRSGAERPANSGLSRATGAAPTTGAPAATSSRSRPPIVLQYRTIATTKNTTAAEDESSAPAPGPGPIKPAAAPSRICPALQPHTVCEVPKYELDR